jgi:hypothetical protein
MYTLLLSGALLDNVGVVAYSLGEVSLPLAVLFYGVVWVSSFTVLNMLIGVLCEVVGAVASVEKEEMTICTVKGDLQSIVNQIDENGDTKISRDEFMQIIENPQAGAALAAVGVDVIGLIDAADSIFDTDDGCAEIELNFPEFLEVVLSLRGSNNTTVKDFVDIRKFLHKNHKHFLSRVEKVDAKVSSLCIRLKELEENRRRATDDALLAVRRFEETLFLALGKSPTSVHRRSCARLVGELRRESVLASPSGWSPSTMPFLNRPTVAE